MTHITDIAIIGAGPVGLFAVFQCGMLDMQCHVIDVLDGVGGQCSALYPEKPIYDIPAHPTITGQGLIDQLTQQMAPFKPTLHLGQHVTQVLQNDQGLWSVITDKQVEITAKAIIIAGGAGAFVPNRPP
jgi:thioredoxin reductase (NADPH)